jgi:antitoxin component YwqK of YwqJK toxin-antitoxin module
MVGAMLKKHDVMMQINYKDGLMHGKWINFNFNGGINFEINFKDGKKDGIWRDYFQRTLGGQGALKKVSVYKENKHISSKYYDFDGDEVSKKEVIDDEEWGGEAWEQEQEF